MSFRKNPLSIFAPIALIVLLAGCGAAETAPAATSTPKAPVLPPPTQKSQPPAPLPTVKPTGPAEVFHFIRTVQVAPDDEFLTGGFVRIGYVPARDGFAVVFGTNLSRPAGGCADKGHAYKEYTLDMQPNGKSGVLNCGVGDSGGIMIENAYFDVGDHAENGTFGWQITKYDAVSWKSLATIYYKVKSPQEGEGDPLVSFANGQLIVGSGTSDTGKPPPPDEGGKSHLNFFSLDLAPQNKLIISDVPHRPEGSILYEGGTYYYITSNAYIGDMIVMRYDKDWKFLGSKTVRKDAQFISGSVYEGGRYYVAYLDLSVREAPGSKLLYPNVHLAAFDRDWDLIQDVPVTTFAPKERTGGRPWVILHGNRLYVSYDVTPHDSTGAELLDQIEAYVSVYEIVR